MNKSEILYFSLSAVILILSGILIVNREKPHEIPAIAVISDFVITENTVDETYEQTSDICSSVSETEFYPVYESVAVISETEEVQQDKTEFPINLNTASKEELMLIKGIGDILADRIIDYRNQHNGFSSVNQLVEVEGIGEIKLEKFSSFLYVEDETEYYPNDVQEYDGDKQDIQEVDRDNQDIYENEPVEISEETQIPEIEIPETEMNSASADDFMKLPGIDEEMALKIVEFREKIQYFSHPYELLYIDGMSKKMLSGIIEYLYIEGREDIIY